MTESVVRMKKVLLWRVCSILLTLSTIWIIRGDLQEATYLTLILHVVLTLSHWLFEWCWDNFGN